MKNKYTVICLDLEILDMFLEYMYRKKYLKKILQKNNQSLPYHGIIIMSITKTDISNIIKKKFNNSLMLR